MIKKDSDITKHVYYVDGTGTKHKVCMAQNGSTIFYPATSSSTIGSMSWPYETGDTYLYPNTLNGCEMYINDASYTPMQPNWLKCPGISKIPGNCTGIGLDSSGGLYFKIPSMGGYSWIIGVSAEVYPYNGTTWQAGGAVHIPLINITPDNVNMSIYDLTMNTWNTIWYEITLTRESEYDGNEAWLYPIKWNLTGGNTVSRNIRSIAISITPV